MSESFSTNNDQDPIIVWKELEELLSDDLIAFADLTYEEFLEIDEDEIIGILYTLE